MKKKLTGKGIKKRRVIFVSDDIWCYSPEETSWDYILKEKCDEGEKEFLQKERCRWWRELNFI